MDIKLEPEALRTLVVDSIFKTLTQEKRDELVRNALAHLMTPVKDPYSRDNRSPLESAFALAAEGIARDVVREELSKPENRQKFSDMVAKALQKVLSDEEEVVSSMAQNLAYAMRHKDR